MVKTVWIIISDSIRLIQISRCAVSRETGIIHSCPIVHLGLMYQFSSWLTIFPAVKLYRIFPICQCGSSGSSSGSICLGQSTSCSFGPVKAVIQHYIPQVWLVIDHMGTLRAVPSQVHWSTTKNVLLFCWRSITTFNPFINFFIPVVSTETFYESLISLVIWISTWFHITTCCTLLICSNVMLSPNPC